MLNESKKILRKDRKSQSSQGRQKADKVVDFNVNYSEFKQIKYSNENV